ncbi:RdgB/HAM1 family non-canonical purine NTP pyrophosphatase [Verrucomicrobiota bacterium]
MKVLVATRNPHKLAEIRAIFSDPAVTLLGADELPGLPEVVEDGETLHANAVKKAVTLALASGLWAMADDSGLEVEALGGEPGVRSARYAGEPVSYAANNRKLLRELAGADNRAARFRCVIALAGPSGRCRTVEGACPGRIAEVPMGDNGFGYDPLFIPDGYAETFAQMEGALKNRLSHRGAALAAARREWSATLARGESDWPPD